MVKYRFQDLDIWRKAIIVSEKFFDIADNLEQKHLFKWAEQLRSSVLSITNNIAEGSGSSSKKEFIQFLNFARRSAFETASILFILQRRNMVDQKEFEMLLDQTDYLSRQITKFQNSLRNKL